MNETTQRFLKEVVGKLAGAEVVELRLFPAIRQGGIESAVAVIAVEPAVPDHQADSVALERGSATASVDADTPNGGANGEPGVENANVEDALVADGALAFEGALASHDPATPAATLTSDGTLAPEGTRRREEEIGNSGSDAPADDDPIPTASTNGIHASPNGVSPYTDDDSPYAEDREPTVASEDTHDEVTAPIAEPARPAARDAVQRFAIMTARYRHVFKGPDRGKWEVDLVHEADAPLATVERVARGVARRAGEALDPEHYSGESLRQALEQPAWDIAT